MLPLRFLLPGDGVESTRTIIKLDILYGFVWYLILPVLQWKFLSCVLASMFPVKLHQYSGHVDDCLQKLVSLVCIETFHCIRSPPLSSSVQLFRLSCHIPAPINKDKLIPLLELITAEKVKAVCTKAVWLRIWRTLQDTVMIDYSFTSSALPVVTSRITLVNYKTPLQPKSQL